MVHYVTPKQEQSCAEIHLGQNIGGKVLPPDAQTIYFSTGGCASGIHTLHDDGDAGAVKVAVSGATAPHDDTRQPLVNTCGVFERKGLGQASFSIYHCLLEHAPTSSQVSNASDQDCKPDDKDAVGLKDGLGLTVTDIARLSGCCRKTVTHRLRDLLAWGLVSQQGKRYRAVNDVDWQALGVEHGTHHLAAQRRERHLRERAAYAENRRQRLQQWKQTYQGRLSKKAVSEVVAAEVAIEEVATDEVLGDRTEVTANRDEVKESIHEVQTGVIEARDSEAGGGTPSADRGGKELPFCSLALESTSQTSWLRLQQWWTISSGGLSVNAD